MFGFQAAGAAPIVDGAPDREPADRRHRHSHRQSRQLAAGATNALKESNGHIDKVTDEEILAAYKLIARTDGIFVEPASRRALAGLDQMREGRKDSRQAA